MHNEQAFNSVRPQNKWQAAFNLKPQLCITLDLKTILHQYSQWTAKVHFIHTFSHMLMYSSQY